MPSYLPKVDSYSTLTRTASADITGGRIVEVSGDKTVAMAAADSKKTLGLAAADAKSGEQVTVFLNESVQRCLAAAAITAGADLYVAANGQVTSTAATNKYGIALSSAASGALVEVRPIN